MIAPPITPFMGRIWSTLTGRSRRLLVLAEVEANCGSLDYSYEGIQTVPLNQIRGSASRARCDDFDANFRPLKAHLESRWQKIQAARRQGAKLPPVALIKVGGIYFVEDGHHRISVAKTHKEQTIQAEVIVLRVAAVAR